MESLLRGLHELDGVQGVFVIDTGGQLRYHHAHAIYDGDLLTEVGRSLLKATESLELQHEEWTGLDAEYGDGRVLVRRVEDFLLVVLADNNLNSSFASVAIRVAITKLKKAVKAGQLDSSGIAMVSSAAPPAAPPPVAPPPPVASASALAASGTSSFGNSGLMSTSGLTWTGSGLGASTLGASGLGGSGVAVVDKKAGEILSRCTKALARAVGPMAKVFVKEGARRVMQNGPFSKELLPALVADLEQQIADADDRAEFRSRMLKK